MGALQNALFIVLGWALGLLSQGLVELIRRKHRRVQLKRSLFIELEGLRITLAALVYTIASNRNAVDRETLVLTESILRLDKTFPTSKTTADEIARLLQLTDEQIANVMASRRETARALGLKTVSLPFLMSQLSSLHLFSIEFQRIALKIASRLTIINEEIAGSNYYHKKTFDSLSEHNYAVVLANMLGSYENVFGLCRPLIDDVTLLLSMKR